MFTISTNDRHIKMIKVVDAVVINDEEAKLLTKEQLYSMREAKMALILHQQPFHLLLKL